MKKKTFLSYLPYVFILVFLLINIPNILSADVNCGNSTREGLEECDDGDNNSDTLPDKCRSDCLFAHCGDGVVDSNEECDDGTHNSNEIPGACRKDCRTPYCGDGVIDPFLGEECDNGSDNSRCSPDCMVCTSPYDNQFIDTQSYTKLCPGTWSLQDNGTPGVILLSAPFAMLDCNGAQIAGDGNGSVGILVSGQGAIVRNCNLSGFTTGIKIIADNVGLYDNRLCGNYKDILNESNSHGQENECSRVTNWQEAGKNGCATTCPPKSHNPTKANTGMKGNLNSSSMTTKPQVATSVKANTRTKIPAKSTQVVSIAGYSFYEMASRARWSSKSAKIVFGSDRVPENGIVRQYAKNTKINGKKATSVLLTQVGQQKNGFIVGGYPYQILKRNVKFNTEISLLPGTPRSVVAKFDVIIGEGKTRKVVASKQLQGGRVERIDVDLSRWGGKKVYFLLKVTALGTEQKTVAALWIDPSLD